MKGIMSRGLVHVIIPKRYNITVSKNRTRMPLSRIFLFSHFAFQALQRYSYSYSFTVFEKDHRIVFVKP